MRVGGHLIAWALGLRAGSRGEGLLLAHDPAFDDCYPGLLAYLLVEEALDGESPLTSYGLGRGEDWWKTDRLLAHAEPRVDATIFGSSARGALLRSLHSRVAAWRGRLRDPAPIERAS
jgi:CelD/BcsL family acetyltransferase involved in cellulose biosynthesis